MPYRVVRDFEAALCEYAGAPYAVTTTSCTMALLLACAWHKSRFGAYQFSIPKRTYVGVPMSIIHAGAEVMFHDEDWFGNYQLAPWPIYDSARHFTSGMYVPEQFQCLSFHWSKILGLGQGGAILHDDAEADEWLRRARFDGRTEGVAPKDDDITMLGYHCYMSPETAAQGLIRLSLLPRTNRPLRNDDYPDLSRMEVFK